MLKAALLWTGEKVAASSSRGLTILLLLLASRDVEPPEEESESECPESSASRVWRAELPPQPQPQRMAPRQ